MKLPTLFKKTSTGASQMWEIEAQSAGASYGNIITRFGQVGGKIQVASDLVITGKNIGKANETTALQQAEAEAKAQWEKKLKKGYVQNLDDAKAGKTDAVIEGGVFPMLAHKFSEQGHKIVYPALAQPKFDGHRCIAVVDEAGSVTLWTRSRKPITGLPHIVAELESFALATGITGPFDGELYNHAYRANFEELSSFIRTPEPKKGHEVVQFHIYDLVDPTVPQSKRSAAIQQIDSSIYPSLVAVETIEVADEDDLMLAFERFLAQGYEGCMVRNMAGLYKINGRSYDLLKVKKFEDAEFVVVGVKEGRGKLAGHAIFICNTDPKDKRMDPNATFDAKMKGETAQLKKYWDDPSLAIGKPLTVKFQGVTNAKRVPRFPVAERFAVKL